MESNNVFLVKIEGLIKEIVAQNDIPYYRIESAMENHIDATGTTSAVPVIRVISYFEDTVSKLANVLAGEFDLAIIKSTDKNNTWMDSFSSQQVNYQAQLKANRLQLTEYKRWAGAKFEVRVCSMLQDAWHGMEREITAGGTAVPDEVKRDFYRVGAFLEMADIEFLKIRTQLTKKKGTVDYAPAPNNMAALPEVTRQVVGGTVNNNNLQQSAPARTAPVNIEAMDMNVDSFSLLAVSVNSIENKSGEGDEHFLDVFNHKEEVQAPVRQEEPVYARYEAPVAVAPAPPTPQPVYTPPPAPPVQDMPRMEPQINPVPVSEPPPPKAPEGVALNVDNIENFNLNVNGMIERTTEVIRENGGTAAAAVVGAGVGAGLGMAAEHAQEKHAASFEDEKPPEPVVDETTQMTDDTLKEYVRNSKVLKEIDQMIAERAGAKVNEDVDIEGDVERLKFLKVFNLKQLHERLTDNKMDVVAFAEKWIGKDNGGSFDSGISLFYLEYLLVGKKNDPAFAVEYVLKFISDNDYSARYIIPTYNAIRQTEGAPTFSHLTLK